MVKNMVQPDRLHVTIQYFTWPSHSGHLRLHRHSEYVILIAFPLQQWLRERTSMLRYTYIACLRAFSFFSLNLTFYFHPQIIQKYHFVTQEFISNPVHKNPVNPFCVYPCSFSMVIIIIIVICVIVALPEQETLSLRNLSFLESITAMKFSNHRCPLRGHARQSLTRHVTSWRQ